MHSICFVINWKLAQIENEQRANKISANARLVALEQQQSKNIIQYFKEVTKDVNKDEVRISSLFAIIG